MKYGQISRRARSSLQATHRPPVGAVCRRFIRRQRGAALIEVLIAASILAIAATTYLSAFSTSSIAIAKEDRRITADALAISQLHYARSLAFDTAPSSYATMPNLPQGYSITTNSEAIAGRDENIQRVTIEVTYSGKVLATLEDFKVNR